MKTKFLIIQFLIIAVFTSNAMASGTHTDMFLTQEEIDVIKLKVDQDQEPWKEAYDTVILRAEAALLKDLQSVTFQGVIGSNIQWHHDDDHPAAIIMSDSVRTLGLAYAFSGDTRYADKAIEFIWTWALDSVTRMRPVPPGKSIQISVTMPALFYGANLIANYDGWDAQEKSDFQAWTQSMANHVRANGQGDNNFSNWRAVMLASAGAFLNDNSLLEVAESEWKRLVSFQMSDSGSITAGMLGEEANRDDGLHYSLFTVNAMIQTAEILNNHGVNLYDYVHEFDNGSTVSLKLALDFITPYAINPDLWGSAGDVTDRYTQENPIAQRHSMAMFELAYSYYQEQQFLDAINRWVRPMYENRIMGITTLTHGNTFDLDFVPIPPTITTQPISQSVEEGSAVTFNVAASGSATLEYQWYRDGDPIGGAMNASYTIDPVLAAYSGSEYHSVVSNDLGEAISNPAELTVVVDTTAPLIDSAVVVSPTQVDIRFSETVTSASAQELINYQISSSIGVLNATLNANNKTVHLQTDSLQADTLYTVTISNIRDTSPAANEITPGSMVEITYSPVMNFDNGQWPLDWIPLDSDKWRIEADNGNNAWFLHEKNYNPLSGDRLGEYVISPDSYGDFVFQAQIRTNEDAGNPNADYAMVFGHEDGSNYYYMMFNRNQSNTILFKVVGGAREQLAAATADWLSDDEYHAVEVRRVGDDIEVRFDGILVLEIADTTFLNGKLGLGSFNDSAYFDDIRISAGTSTDLIFINDFE